MENENVSPAEQATEQTTEVVQPPYSVAAEIEKLFDYLKTIPVGETVDYAVILALIEESRDGARWRNILRQAVKRLQDELGLVFVAVRGVGIKHQDEAGKVRKAHTAIPAIRRRSRNARKVLGCVNTEELSPPDLNEYVLVSSTLGVIMTMTSPKFLGKLSIKCTDATQGLSANKVLELFLRTGKN